MFPSLLLRAVAFGLVAVGIAIVVGLDWPFPWEE